MRGGKSSEGRTGAPLFIHIGAHKTGSSTIQAFLRDHEAALAARGILYPTIGRTVLGAHHGLGIGLRDGLSDEGRKMWEEVRRLRVEAPEGHRIVLSSEAFVSLPREQVRYLQRLIGAGPVKILFYVREIAGAVVSGYGQLTKMGNNLLDFDRYFKRHAEAGSKAWVGGVSRWATAFGAENVRIRMLHPTGLVGGDLMEDCLHALGTSMAELGADSAPLRNVAPGWRVTETLRAFASRLGEEERARAFKRMPRIVEEMGQDASLAPALKERGEYLTLEQRRICGDLTRRMIEGINAILPGTNLRMPPSAPAAERPFLPSIERMSAAEAEEVMVRVRAKLAERRVKGRGPRQQKAGRLMRRAMDVTARAVA